MATYTFSALSDGQAIAFNPGADVLNFDQQIISAANIFATVEGTSVRLTVHDTGTAAGKSVVLQNTSPLQLATSNITFTNGSALLFGDNSPGTANDNLANTLNGTAGNDLLQGFGGADTLNGGTGNDTYIVGAGDVINDTGGTDTIVTDISFNLAANIENLTMTGSANISADGNTLANVITGNSGSNVVWANNGDDTVIGGAGNDDLHGESGNDWMEGGLGNDTIGGGGDKDHIAFREFGAANADNVITFATNWDDIQLDLAAFTALGSNGRFAAGDVRFFSGSAAHDADDRIIYNSTTGQLWYDADGNGAGAAQLIANFGAGTAIAATDINVFGTATPPPPPPPPPGTNGTAGNDVMQGTAGPDTMNGLAGDDTLIGGDGDDRLDGGDGNDQIDGGAGNDLEIGGAGNDVLGSNDFNHSLFADADPGNDTLNGGLGDDTFFAHSTDTLIDEGGIDTVEVQGESWTLAAGFENLIFYNHQNDNGFTGIVGTGNDLNNIINGMQGADGIVMHGLGGNDSLVGTAYSDTFDGGTGNDTLDAGLSGGGTQDLYLFSAAPGAANADTLTHFSAGLDKIELDGTVHANIGPSGNFTAGDGRFFAAAGATSGHDADDRVVYNTSTGQLWYDADGNGVGAAQLIATLQGAPAISATDIAVINGSSAGATINGTPGDDTLAGGPGNDTLNGLDGSDSLSGNGGDDRLVGGRGSDVVAGGAGADTFVLSADPSITFPSNADTITDFVSAADTIEFDGTFFQNGGATGRLATGDARFYAAPGANAGHDADDRFIYDTSTGQLWYDTDGSGSKTAMVVATLQGAPTLAATDIVYTNGTTGSSTTGTAGNDNLVGTPNNDTIDGLGGNDTINGAGGADTLIGGAGNDSLFGGARDDVSFGYDPGDQFIGGDGDDTMNGSQFHGSVTIDTMDGGLGNDYYIVDNPGDVLTDTGGIDTVESRDIAWTLGAGFENLYLNNQVSEGSRDGTGNELDNHMSIGWTGRLFGLGGNDTLEGGVKSSQLFGGDGNDLLVGGTLMDGGAGNDTIDGGGTMTGGTGADVFTFRGGFSSRSVTDFAPGSDKLQLDGAAFTEIGASGNFAPNDERFYAAPGAVAAHDTTDRLIYNTTTGDLYYDADGSNANAPVLIANLQGAPSLAATDIAVINGTTPPPAGNTINGTAGNDTLVGGSGNDTLNGLDGADSLVGNAGDDSLNGGNGIDTMDGGLGNDTYVVTAGDVLVDAGGTDTVMSDGNWNLGADFENLTLLGTGNWQVQGNNLANFVVGNSGVNYFNTRAGDDTIMAGSGNDSIDISTGSTSTYGNKVIDGGDGFDTIDIDGYAHSGITVNLGAGTMSGGGDAGAGMAQLSNIERVVGGGFDDRITGSAGANQLEGRGGNDTLAGAGGIDTLVGGSGADSFQFGEFGTANADRITDFASGSDRMLFDHNAFTTIGALGNFSAGDARFYAASGAIGGHDADDRLVYNTSTGQLYYDDDGSGSHAAQLVATLNAGQALAATDLTVI